MNEHFGEEQINPPSSPIKGQSEIPLKDAAQVQTLGAVITPSSEPAPRKMRIDLHCHSEASPDSSTPLQLIPARCQARNIQVQAITDHNTIWGAQRLKEMLEEGIPGCEGELTVIVGEEVSSTHGEIIGLFLQEKIPAGLTPLETVKRIKEQGGLVLLPHGFDPLKRWRLQPTALEEIADEIDIVETFNARISRPTWNRAAVTWSQKRNCPMSAGSDAHTLHDIGSAWIEVPHETVHTPADLLRVIRNGVPMGEWTHPVVAYVKKAWDRSLRRLHLRT